MKKRIFKAIVFIIIIAVLFAGISPVLSYKFDDGILQAQALYDQPQDSVDLLFIGSSRAFVNVSPACLYREYGIASYIDGGSMQPMWNSYYALKEALKTQKPKLVMLEAFATLWDMEYSNATRIIKNTFGMAPSVNKLEALADSAPDGELGSYLLEFLQFHSRYGELTESDYRDYSDEPFRRYYKGNTMSFASFPHEKPVVLPSDVRNPIPARQEEWYRKTIALAQENDVPICIFVSPYAGYTQYAQGVFNSAADVAAEYGVPFVNFNSDFDRIGIDFATDIVDTAHMNYRGAFKFSRCLGEYVTEHYALPDRRGDSAYDSWEQDAALAYRRIDGRKFFNASGLPEYMRLIADNSSYLCFISITDTASAEALFEVSAAIGRQAQASSAYALYDDRLLFASPDTQYAYHTDMCGDVFLLRRSGYTTELIMNNEERSLVSKGINILVYDPVTEMVVDTAGFDAEEDYACIHGEDTSPKY